MENLFSVIMIEGCVLLMRGPIARMVSSLGCSSGPCPVLNDMFLPFLSLFVVSVLQLIGKRHISRPTRLVTALQQTQVKRQAPGVHSIWIETSEVNAVDAVDAITAVVHHLHARACE